MASKEPDKPPGLVNKRGQRGVSSTILHILADKTN